MSQTFAIGIGGAAGQGVATPGNIFARIFPARFASSRLQRLSIHHPGRPYFSDHTHGSGKDHSFGDQIDLMIPLNQDTMDRHLRLLGPGAAVVYNGDTIKPGAAPAGVRLCPLPVSELATTAATRWSRTPWPWPRPSA